MAVYILLDLIALIGTTKSSRWPLIGWIVLEFIRIFSMMICTIIAIIIWAVYMDDSKDTSYMIAVAVIGMMLISMLFHLNIQGEGHCVFKWILRGHFQPPPNATI